MIAYVDSSVLARAYLADEPGHTDAVGLLDDSTIALITSTWTRIEVAGALVRAARAGRVDDSGLLRLLEADLGTSGSVTVVGAPQEQIEDHALELVCEHAIRAMDAWHLAVAQIVLATLAEPGEDLGFATRDDTQAPAAAQLGFTPI